MKVPLAGADAAGNPTETLLSEVGLVLLKMFVSLALQGGQQGLRGRARELLDSHQLESVGGSVHVRKGAAAQANALAVLVLFKGQLRPGDAQGQGSGHGFAAQGS